MWVLQWPWSAKPNSKTHNATAKHKNAKNESQNATALASAGKGSNSLFFFGSKVKGEVYEKGTFHDQRAVWDTDSSNWKIITIKIYWTRRCPKTSDRQRMNSWMNRWMDGWNVKKKFIKKDGQCICSFRWPDRSSLICRNSDDIRQKQEPNVKSQKTAALNSFYKWKININAWNVFCFFSSNFNIRTKVTFI